MTLWLVCRNRVTDSRSFAMLVMERCFRTRGSRARDRGWLRWPSNQVECRRRAGKTSGDTSNEELKSEPQAGRMPPSLPLLSPRTSPPLVSYRLVATS